MAVVKKGLKPKVGPKRMPAEVVELTTKFKKQYDSKELNQLWGAMVACYGNDKLAIQAAFENPQIVNPSVSFCARPTRACKGLCLCVFMTGLVKPTHSSNPGLLFAVLVHEHDAREPGCAIRHVHQGGGRRYHAQESGRPPVWSVARHPRYAQRRAAFPSS